jgi:Mor family transcriptional regulator
MNGRVPEKSERNKAIYEDRKSGLTYSAIAKKYGLTGTRVRMIALTYDRNLNRNKRDWLFGLPRPKVRGKGKRNRNEY